MKKPQVLCTILLLFCCSISQAQQPVATDMTVVVPPLMNFSGVLTESNGKPISVETSVTFMLYKESQGGSPLWMESQNVKPDSTGHYSVMLGATSSQGLPPEIFVAGQAHWLAVQVQGQEEQVRVLLVSAPYALKAGDAQTLGGMPASAFVLAAPPNSGAVTPTITGNTALPMTSSVTQSPSTGNTPVTTAGGTNGKIPLWDSTSDITSSIITQTGTGSSAKLGINLANPLMTLDVNGSELVRGLFEMATTGYATSSKGFNSNPLNIESSAFNSSTSKYTLNHFQWQAEPVGNDTATPGATLNLLYGQDPNPPAETGLKIASNGQFTFATGQKFPGTGTITGVTAGSGLTGGGTSGTVTISVKTAGITNAMLQFSAVTVAAGTDLTGGGSVPLGGTTTLNLDTTKVPSLAAANVFTNSDTFTGSTASPELSVTNNGSGDGIDIFSTAGDAVYSESEGFDGGDFLSLGTGYGIFASSTNDSSFSSAAAGWQFGASKEDIGVWGFAGSTVGIGNYSEGFAASVEGTKCCGGAYSIGLWADTSGTSGSDAGIAALATVDTGYGLVTYSNSTDSTIWAENDVTGDTGAPVLVATGPSGYCLATVSGDLTCTGTITPAVSIDGGAKKVAVYGVQAAENWVEDAGSAQLANGAAVVRLESTFAETVNAGVEYHVFLTPNGDCKGLYVSQKSPTSFEVHELGGGTSNTAFDYRIMAKRRGYETVRLEDKTAALAVRNPNRRPPGVRGPNPDDARKAHQAKVDATRKLAMTRPVTAREIRK